MAAPFKPCQPFAVLQQFMLGFNHSNQFDRLLFSPYCIAAKPSLSKTSRLFSACISTTESSLPGIALPFHGVSSLCDCPKCGCLFLGLTSYQLTVIYYHVDSREFSNLPGLEARSGAYIHRMRLLPHVNSQLTLRRCFFFNSRRSPIWTQDRQAMPSAATRTSQPSQPA